MKKFVAWSTEELIGFIAAGRATPRIERYVCSVVDETAKRDN